MSICVALSVQTTAFAEGKNSKSSNKEKELLGLQEQARLYHEKGLALQRRGDLDDAIIYYKKSAVCDPNYPVAHNDLGVIYEIKGLPGAAEECYLKAIQIDPLYLSAYSNLAMLYENKHMLDKAASYWEKRVELGSPDDPWTQKARERLEDIRAVSGYKTPPASREEEILELSKDVSAVKHQEIIESINPPGQNNVVRAQRYFEKAQASYAKGDSITALKEALEAQQLDPSNKSILAFIDELQRKLLSR